MVLEAIEDGLFPHEGPPLSVSLETLGKKIQLLLLRPLGPKNGNPALALDGSMIFSPTPRMRTLYTIAPPLRVDPAGLVTHPARSPPSGRLIRLKTR